MDVAFGISANISTACVEEPARAERVGEALGNHFGAEVMVPGARPLGMLTVQIVPGDLGSSRRTGMG